MVNRIEFGIDERRGLRELKEKERRQAENSGGAATGATGVKDDMNGTENETSAV